MTDTRHPAGFRWHLAISVLLAAGLGAGAVAVLEAQSRNVLKLHGDRLATTAKLLGRHLADWRQVKRADAEVLALAPAAGLVLEGPDEGPELEDVWRWLDRVRRLEGYESVALVDRTGRPRLAAPPQADPRLDLGAMSDDDSSTLVEELQTDHGHAHLHAVATVGQGGRPVGFVVLTSDVQEAVARLEGVARRGEARVFSERGGSVLALAGPRVDGAAAPVGIGTDPLAAAARPALREGSGLFETLDDRGERVLGAAARVPSSPWFVVAAVDRSVALASGRGTAIKTMLLFGTLVAVVGVGSLLLWVTQGRVVQRRLLESQRRYDVVFQNSLSGIAVHEIVRDEAGRAVDYVFLEANPAFERLTGLERRDILGRRATDVLPGLEKTHFIETYGRVVLSGEAKRFESFAAPIGRHYDVAAFPMGGSLFGTIFADITARREAEEALRERERYLTALFEGALDPILVADDDGRWVDVNPAAAHAFGLARSEVVGRRLGDFAADDDYDFDAVWGRFLAAGQMTGIFRARRGDEAVRTFELAATARVAPSRHVAVLRDVTERSQAEQALKDNETLSRLVLETIPVGVWLLDRTGHITYANPAARRIWGGARFVGPDQFDVFKGWRLPDHTPIAAKDWGALRALEKGVALFADAIEIQTFDGVRRQILYSALPIRDEKDAIAGVLVTNEDVTEQRRLEQQFQQAQKMEAVGRLAGGVAHDFNNLLAIVTGRGGALERLLAPDHPGRRHLEQIQEAAERASALTRQLLAFGRKQVHERRPVRLNDVVVKVAPMLERLLGEDLQLSTELGDDLDPVLADVHQLEQVLMNLAVNARDAMPDGGTLTITTSAAVVEESMARWRRGGLEAGRYVLLTVEDTGQGMDAETRSRLFEPFFTTKEAGHGTGLGLSTVYGIVSQTGGRIQVDSAPGRGTTFRIHLPVTDQEVEATAATTPAGRAEGHETILVVEDERSLRDLIQEDLEELGYTVLPAASPAEALELATSHSHRVDLVLTDVILPKMNGRELVNRLCESRPGLTAVYMSGYSASVIAHHGVLEPGVHFLQKPFAIQALAARIREALDTSTGG